MAKKNNKKVAKKVTTKAADKGADEAKPATETTEAKQYEAPVFLTDDLGHIGSALQAAENAIGKGTGPEVSAEFVKVDKKAFGYSTEGKMDFCRHQIALYLARLAELKAEDSPEAQAARKLARLKKQQEKREAEIAELEKTMSGDKKEAAKK